MLDARIFYQPEKAWYFRKKSRKEYIGTKMYSFFGLEPHTEIPGSTFAPTPKMKRYGFSKRDRLRKRREFLQLANTGKKMHERHFLAIFDVKNVADKRLGITVTKRIGNAAARNRIKRLCREAFRHERESLPAGIEINIIAKSGAPGCSNTELLSELSRMFTKLRGNPSLNDSSSF